MFEKSFLYKISRISFIKVYLFIEIALYMITYYKVFINLLPTLTIWNVMDLVTLLDEQGYLFQI